MNRKTDLSTALGTSMTLGRRRLLFGAGAIGGAALLTACTGNEPEDDDASAANVNAGSGDNAAPGKEVTIGFSAPAADHGWIAAITTNAKAQAEQYEDVTLNAVEGSNDVNQQISQVETLISQKLDVLVILPFDGQALTEVAIRAMEAGIPVINLDRVFSSPRGARALDRRRQLRHGRRPPAGTSPSRWRPRASPTRSSARSRASRTCR